MARPDRDDDDRDARADDAEERDVLRVGRARTPVSQQVGRVAMVVAGAVFALFAIFNAQHVDFSWVFGSTEVVTAGGDRVTGGVPLIVLLLGAFVLGAVVGFGAALRRRRG